MRLRSDIVCSLIVVVVDSFRAATTACHVLARGPRDYLIVADSEAAARLAATSPYPLLLGKPEVGATLVYDLPNSPTRLAEVDLSGRTVIHRSSAGGRGVLGATANTDVFLAGFVNAKATARVMYGRNACLLPMGHEGLSPSLEDDVAAQCIAAGSRGEHFDINRHLEALRNGPGRYFFGKDQVQYPRADFERCLAIDAFDFAVRAERFGDYARLSRA